MLAALSNPARKKTKLFVTEEARFELSSDLAGLVPISIKSRKEIDTLFPPGSVHQGFALFCEPLKEPSLRSFLLENKKTKKMMMVVLDQVFDPQNVGAIMRSSLAFGAAAVVMQEKNSPQETASLVKAAAGTFEKLPLIREVNITRAIEELKKEDFWAVGLSGHASAELSSIPDSHRTCLVLGSEGKGMRSLVEKSCDFTARLPIADEVESLNVSVAAGIALYELSRKTA